MDAAIRGTGSRRHHGPGLGSQAVDPFTGQDGLAGILVPAKAGPVALALVLLIGDGAFDN